jgi:ABC-type siderophore export system fused ATPase/permease subunit
MSIFVVITISVLLGIVGFMLGAGISETFISEHRHYKLYFAVPIILAIVSFVASIFTVIGIATEQEHIYIATYEAQKETIEQSIDSETLTGFERIELVKTATELNGEMTKRKAKANRWHVVYYDNTLYDYIEPISLESK